MREMNRTELSHLSAGCGLVKAAILGDPTKDRGNGDPKPIKGDDGGSGSNTGIDVVVGGGNDNGLYDPFPG